MDAVAVERGSHRRRERRRVDRDLASRGRDDLALALQHVHELVVRDAVRLLPRLAHGGGRERGRRDLHRRRADARGEGRRELRRALR